MGGILLGNGGARADIYNTSFIGTSSTWHTALSTTQGEEDNPIVLNCYFCYFAENKASESGFVTVGWWFSSATFYDCIFERNAGSLIVWETNVPTSQVKSEFVRCAWIDNIGTKNAWPGPGAALILGGGGRHLLTDCVFERNNAGLLDGGALGVLANAYVIVRNVTFIENVADSGAIVTIVSGASVTMISCYARGNTANNFGSLTWIPLGTLTIYNSTFLDSLNPNSWASVARVAEGVANVYGSVFLGAIAGPGHGISLLNGGSMTFVDSHLEGWSCGGPGAGIALESGSFLRLLRTTLKGRAKAKGKTRTHPLTNPLYDGTGMVAATTGGCLDITGGSTAIVEDSHLIDCQSQTGAAMIVASASTVTITDSHIVGSYATLQGDVAHVSGGSVLRIAGGSIVNSSEAGDGFAIYDKNEAGSDFGVQLDSVVADETLTILSPNLVLLQNTEGVSTQAVNNATNIATCQSSSDFCLASSCSDTTIGIDCACIVDGVATIFPTNCMASAAIKVAVPSTHTLTYLVEKPNNETAEASDDDMVHIDGA